MPGDWGCPTEATLLLCSRGQYLTLCSTFSDFPPSGYFLLIAESSRHLITVETRMGLATPRHHLCLVSFHPGIQAGKQTNKQHHLNIKLKNFPGTPNHCSWRYWKQEEITLKGSSRKTKGKEVFLEAQGKFGQDLGPVTACIPGNSSESDMAKQ